MGFDAHKNLAYSTVATAPSPATSGASLVVAAGEGAKFPAVPFNVTVWPIGAQPTTANSEIVRVTAISTDTLTITRAQEGSVARSIVVGDQIAGTLTAKSLTDVEADVTATDTQVAIQAATIESRRIADLGRFVMAGMALSPNASQVTGMTTSSPPSSTNVFNKTTHGLVAGDTIVFGNLANTTGVSNNVVYFVSATGLTANVFRVAATLGGTALTLGGTQDTGLLLTQVGKLDMALGAVYKLFNEVAVSGQTAISTTVASMADATSPKWVVVEFDSPTTVAFNQGTAASTPAFPTITTSKLPLGFVYIPAGATKVDTLLDTNNGNAKLFDARILRPGPTPSGWVYDQNAWAYASANSFTISNTDATSYLTPGTKVSLNDGTGKKFGVVASSSFPGGDTTVTLITATESAMSDPGGSHVLLRGRYSQAATPQEFPEWFNWAPTVVGWTASPPTAVYQWKSMGGNSILITIRHSNTQTSTGATHTITLPVAAATVTNAMWGVICRATDNGTVQFGAVQVLSAGTTANMLGNGFAGSNAATGASNIFAAQLVYQF